jgi:hypothetical protein
MKQHTAESQWRGMDEGEDVCAPPPSTALDDLTSVACCRWSSGPLTHSDPTICCGFYFEQGVSMGPLTAITSRRQGIIRLRDRGRCVGQQVPCGCCCRCRDCRAGDHECAGRNDQHHNCRGDRPIDEARWCSGSYSVRSRPSATTVGTSSEVARPAVLTMFWVAVTLGV